MCQLEPETLMGGHLTEVSPIFLLPRLSDIGAILAGASSLGHREDGGNKESRKGRLRKLGVDKGSADNWIGDSVMWPA